MNHTTLAVVPVLLDRLVATGLVLTCWIAAPAAQRTQTPTNEPAHNVYVLTGCLERGDSPTAFRLTRASAVGQAPPRQGASTQTEPDVYELQAVSSVSEQGFSSEKLQPEVGTRVELTIRPVEAALPAPPQPASTNAAAKPAESPRPRFSVHKLERLADSCK
jgi:hypothetical protein